ncbi:MAG: sugar phosphate nucleotidyltransferase [Elusimicrobiota bacterium]|nr:sugar phosphate nucleotidyltransferase [Elusimicrobiota bacterium]
MQSIILAGGFGTRLRPLTIAKPKPMIDVANAPIMEHVINLLKKNNSKNITSLLYYQPDIIKNYFANGKKFGIKMDYVKTNADLGTAGAAGTCRGKMKDTFMVTSGDVICDFDLKKAVAFHKKRKALATIILTHVEDPLQYGIVITKKDGRISSFLEKPTWGEVFSDTINTGTYIFEPEIFKYLPEGREMDFSKNLFPALLENKERLFGYICPGYWKDVGNLGEYLNSHYDTMAEKIKLGIKARKKIRNGFPVWAGKNTVIPEKIKFDGPAIFGDNVTIGDYATIGDSCFGNGCRIGKYSKISRSVLQEDSKCGHHCDIKETIVGFGTNVSDNVKTSPGAVVGNDCDIGSGATLKAHIKVWPQKTVEAGAFVNSSVIWSDRFSKNLFGNHGINGLANIEITPEFATRLGAALGDKIGKGKYVLTSRDANQNSRMIKRSIIAGLISTGVKVGDLRTMPIPVVRYESGKEGESGGIHVRMSPFDSRIIDILFFDESGCEISPAKQKAIEQTFFKDDITRAGIDEVGEIMLPPRASEYYREGFLSNLDETAIRKKSPRIVCDYAFSPASLIFPSILGRLKIETISLNGVLHPQRTSKTHKEFIQSLETVANVVKSVKADLGVMFDVGGEKIFIIDGKGNRIHSQKAMLAVLSLLGMAKKKGSICLPVNCTVQAKKIAKKYGLAVTASGATPQRIMDTCKEKDIVFGADGKGGFIFPEFQPSFDGMFSICKIIELCSVLGVNLSDITSKIKDPEISGRSIYCPWEKKGLLMRKLSDAFPAAKTELVDGIKLIEKKSWILFMPSSDKASFNLSCEAPTKREARKIIARHAEKIKKWLK